MNTKKTVFNRMAKGMPKKNVKLAIVDDLTTDFSYLEEAYSNANYLAYEYGDELIGKIEEYRSEIGQIDDFIINGMATSLLEISQDYSKLLEQLDAKANDLGLDPRDIFDQYDEAKEYVSFAEASYKDARDKYKEVVEYAGFLNDFWR